jgi:hypothetical protein
VRNNQSIALDALERLIEATHSSESEDAFAS